MKLIQTLIASSFVILASSFAAEPRPNVVILLADDAGWGDHSRNGNTQVRSPTAVQRLQFGVRSL